MAEYKLPFTGQQIEEKLKKVEDIPTKVSELENDSGYRTESDIFIATYGETTYEQLKEAYDQKKTIFLRIPNIAINHKDKIYNDCIANLVRFENDNRDGTDRYVFTFSCDENGVVHYAAIDWQAKTWNQWDANYTDNILKFSKQMSVANNHIISLLPLLTSSLNSFRGGFRNTAGTLDIKCPGIYFIMNGGKNDKTITITQPGNTTEITKNGFIILAYDNGVGTVIGVSGISITNLNPISTGTYQLWSPDGTYHTEVSYSDMTVVAYLGNSINDVGTWD